MTHVVFNSPLCVLLGVDGTELSHHEDALSKASEHSSTPFCERFEIL